MIMIMPVIMPGPVECAAAGVPLAESTVRGLERAVKGSPVHPLDSLRTLWQLASPPVRR